MVSLPVYVHCSSLVKARSHRSLGDHSSRIIRAVQIFNDVSRDDHLSSFWLDVPDLSRHWQTALFQPSHGRQSHSSKTANIILPV